MYLGLSESGRKKVRKSRGTGLFGISDANQDTLEKVCRAEYCKSRFDANPSDGAYASALPLVTPIKVKEVCAEILEERSE